MSFDPNIMHTSSFYLQHLIEPSALQGRHQVPLRSPPLDRWQRAAVQRTTLTFRLECSSFWTPNKGQQRFVAEID